MNSTMDWFQDRIEDLEERLPVDVRNSFRAAHQELFSLVENHGCQESAVILEQKLTTAVKWWPLMSTFNPGCIAWRS